MVRKIETSRRDEPEPDGPRAMTALVVLREKVINPLLAASRHPESQTKPFHAEPVCSTGDGRIRIDNFFHLFQ
jgi:hypothetical protein